MQGFVAVGLVWLVVFLSVFIKCSLINSSAQCYIRLVPAPQGSILGSMRRITEKAKLEGTPKDHQSQLLALHSTCVTPCAPEHCSNAL